MKRCRSFASLARIFIADLSPGKGKKYFQLKSADSQRVREEEQKFRRSREGNHIYYRDYNTLTNFNRLNFTDVSLLTYVGTTVDSCNLL